jgi:membrane protease subunit HflC
MRKSALLMPIFVVAIALGLSSMFIVDEREKALVLQFGQIKSIKEDPGLAFKIPFIQEVVRYDDRILSLDTPPIEVTPSDDRRLVVDAFARYRIEDVVQFRQAVGVGGIRAAEDRLASILIARAKALGLDVIDVRLKQTNLPEQNLAATFARMRAEREREAADEIARGEEAAQRVRAQADRTVVELVSEARKESEIVRGEADAERNKIFAQAFSADPDFFEFYRSLSAYENALKGENSSMVITPDSEFFEFLGGDGLE